MEKARPLLDLECLLSRLLGLVFYLAPHDFNKLVSLQRPPEPCMSRSWTKTDCSLRAPGVRYHARYETHGRYLTLKKVFIQTWFSCERRSCPQKFKDRPEKPENNGPFLGSLSSSQGQLLKDCSIPCIVSLSFMVFDQPEGRQNRGFFFFFY